MLEEFEKAINKTLRGLSRVFSFLYDILIVSKVSMVEHNCLGEKVFIRLQEEG